MDRRLFPGRWLAVVALMAFAADAPAAEAPRLYAELCASCHGTDRLGVSGPALFSESLNRIKKGEIVATITGGRPASQMPGFSDKLSADEIAALADFVLTPLPTIPVWGMEETRASHVVHNALETLPATPVHSADPMNLFTVVEVGDHHVTILDGDAFEPVWRFPSRFALHGGAKYSPDGRFVYLGSRDGWVSKYDLYGLKPVAEIRAGVNTRNIAVSSDGRYVAVGNTLPHTLTILDARDLTPLRIIPVADGKGNGSRVSAVYTAPPRKSFIVALKDIPEVWEVHTSEDHPPVYPGMVHSFEKGMEEAVGAETGLFAVRRIVLGETLDDFFFDQSYTHLIGASRDGTKGQVVNLTVGRKIAEVELPGMPHLGSGITFQYQGRPVLATPHLKDGVVSIIDMTDWKTIKRIKTLGPGFFVRGHENSPYAWVDAFLSPEKDTVQVIDTRTLEIARTLRPEPGKTAAHVEFTRNGRHALVSIWEMEGALVVYDAATFEEVKRIPMKKPVGKYNVWNKTHYSQGTSH
ncbi:MAG: c-type cytochrome [Alphaproteobacteria bacterium]|nr:c-type cytochrome [Alphaproteobacteria bacterium]